MTLQKIQNAGQTQSGQPMLVAPRTVTMPKLLPFPELKDHGVLYGRRQIDRLEAAGKFPKRVPIGDSRVGWVETEVDAHVNRAIASRSKAVGTLGSARATK